MKIGIAGLGFMGATHWTAYSNVTDAEVVAVCSRSARPRSGHLEQTGGNLQREASQHDLSTVQQFQGWEAMVQDPELDVIDICLPTDMHERVAIAALEAGKHVFCEKPMALDREQCERMLEAAARRRRILMIGQVLRFWPEYRYLKNFVASGEYGRIRSATFIRRCGVPDWSRWLPDESKSGGAVLDLLSHDIDQALLLFGIPERVAAKRIGDSDTLMGTLIYPGGQRGPEVRIQGGWFASGTPFSMSFQVRAEGAELEWTSGVLTLSDASGNRRRVEASGEDAYESEIKYFLDCCRTGSQPDVCMPQESARAVAIANLLKESRAQGGAQLGAR